MASASEEPETKRPKLVCVPSGQNWFACLKSCEEIRGFCTCAAASATGPLVTKGEGNGAPNPSRPMNEADIASAKALRELSDIRLSLLEADLGGIDRRQPHAAAADDRCCSATSRLAALSQAAAAVSPRAAAAEVSPRAAAAGDSRLVAGVSARTAAAGVAPHMGAVCAAAAGIGAT